MSGVDPAVKAQEEAPKEPKVLAMKSKPPASQGELRVLASVTECDKKINRVIPNEPKRILNATGLSNDFYCNNVDWSSKNVVAVVLGQSLYLWNGDSGTIDELCSQDGITSVKWSADGQYLAVGKMDSEMQLWNPSAKKILRKLRSHEGRVGCSAWHEHVLASGSKDCQVHLSDVRIKDYLLQRHTEHEGEVVSLEWSPDFKNLASGSNDNTVCIWQENQMLHRLQEHRAAVKALSWCPWQSGHLATGGGSTCQKLKLWNVQNGRCMKSVDTGSQVCSIVWNAHERELLTGHGFSDGKHMSLWQYPGLTKMTSLGVEERVLSMCRSPDGSMVLTASEDNLRFWDIFPTPGKKENTKPARQIR